MSLARRLSAAFAAALLLFSTQADVYASSHCAHHAAAAETPAQDEHAGHAGHGAPADKPDHSGACTCLGMCAASAPVAVPQTTSVAAFQLSFQILPAGRASVTVLPASTRYLIPFSTAPPHVS